MSLYIKIISLLLFFTSASFASGWNDFKLDIGNGYQIIKINSNQIDLLHFDSAIISSRIQNKDKVGPVYAYSFVDDYLLIKMKTWKKEAFKYKSGDNAYTRYRKVPTRDTFNYAILDKNTAKIIGFYSDAHFLQEIMKLDISDINWKKVNNPNVLFSLISRLIFLIVALYFYLYKYLTYVLIFTFFIGFAFYCIKRK